ncbi:MAG: Osmosensitive channel histidine kinaselike protein [Acidimicrobiales bacterium]|nr:Osmosensitive channel histidine kinaselike protein [Acidimicrobiales bacterium]
MAAGGALAAIAAAGLLVALRDAIGTTNVALTLAVLVASVAAAGGRLPGAATGVAAAVSYNFFQTQPYRSLRISDRKDVLTVVLLAVVGLVVGELSRRWERSRWDASRSRVGLDRVVRVAELASAGSGMDELIHAVEAEVRQELHLGKARFELGRPAGEVRPVLDHHGVVQTPVRAYVDGEFALPDEGVDLAVTYRDHAFGRLVLSPHRHVGVSLPQRRCAVALADQLGAALAAVAASP